VYSGQIPLDSIGPLDLQATLESGQSYLWWREGDRAYGDPPGSEDESTTGPWYYTTTRVNGDPDALRVRTTEKNLEWESTTDAAAVVRRRLGLADDLSAIRTQAPADDVVESAFDAYWGMRVVRGPAFPTLVSFICSTQMRVGRIHAMQQSLRESLGSTVSFEGKTIHAYPTPEQLAATSEETLRDLSLGYRAPYVQETAAMVADGLAPDDVRDTSYEDAREELTRYVGVGQKVADCVLLFSLGYLEAVPLDTWMQRTVATYYPDCDRDKYAETSRALRERLGGEIAGYTQTYLFHYLRNGGG